MQNHVWKLQHDTCEILNKTIQIAFKWDIESRDHYQATGAYRDLQKETGYKRIDGLVYDKLKNIYHNIGSRNLNATIQVAYKRYKDSRGDVLAGKISLPSYKKDHPIVLYAKNIKLSEQNGPWRIRLTLFSSGFQQDGLDSKVTFAIKPKDGTQQAILSRLGCGEYIMGQSQLAYEHKKWFLYLTYSFVPQKLSLDPNKILGIDLGVVYVACASSIGSDDRFIIEGDKTFEYAQILEKRKRSRQAQARFCGDGRVGHGTKTRVRTAYNDGHRLANHQATLNHRYSKALVDYAVKTGCGTIQMEKLEGIKEDTGFPRRLQHWTYFDLQQKIRYKAEERGIAVVLVEPRYTSQRCSRCGNIDKDNRPTQKEFRCTKCGTKLNADFNASQNLSVAGIDKIIDRALLAASKE